MVVDCHYHLDQRLLTVDQLLKKMDACGVDKVGSLVLVPMFIGAVYLGGKGIGSYRLRDLLRL